MQSIRSRIVFLFAACFIFGGVLTILHYTNMNSLKHKMIMMENFDGLLDNLLELRRFEKNFTYYRDEASVSNWERYMVDVEKSVAMLRDDIIQVVGDQKFLALQEELGVYKEIVKNDMNQGAGNQSAETVQHIRDKGKSLVDHAQNMIRTKRKHIDDTVNRSVMLPVTYFIFFILLTIIVFQLVDSGILKPLSLIKEALNHAASESFKPIAYHSNSENEVTKLIDLFNKVALELETRQEQLLQSKKLASIGTFTSGIAHELNNPLNNISLTAETLQYTFDEMDVQERKTLIEDILTQADRASQVVKNLLEFSRMDKPEMIQINIQQVLERTVKLVKNQLMVKNIRLEKELSDSLPQIYGKQQQLENAFVNIIINAIQAMPDGGTLGICSKPVLDAVRIDISDTGAGISEKQLGYIFDPFFTTKEVGKGTGLGLSLVYGIIHAHGGTIEVASKVNQGSCFSIFLPTNTKKEDLS